MVRSGVYPVFGSVWYLYTPITVGGHRLVEYQNVTVSRLFALEEMGLCFIGIANNMVIISCGYGAEYAFHGNLPSPPFPQKFS